MKPAHTAADYAQIAPSFNATRQRWEMPDGRCERMQCLFASEAEALEFKRISLANLASREKWEVDNAAAKAKAEAERAAYLASFHGWLNPDPMRAGRQLQTMERQCMHRGVARTRKQIVDTLIAEGRTLTENGLESTEGSFLVLGKTERSYAAHVLALKISPIEGSPLQTATV